MQLVEDQRLTKEYFFKDLGYSSANFRGDNLNAQVGSDALVNIIAKYNVSAHWLLTGEGEMYRKDDNNMAAEPVGKYSQTYQERYIQALEREIASKEKIISLLEKEIKSLGGKLPNAGSKAV